MGCSNSKEESTAKSRRAASFKRSRSSIARPSSPSVSIKASNSNSLNSQEIDTADSRKTTISSHAETATASGGGFSDPISCPVYKKEDFHTVFEEAELHHKSSDEVQKDADTDRVSHGLALEILDPPPQSSTASSTNDTSLGNGSGRMKTSSSRSMTSTTGDEAEGPAGLSFIAPASGTSSILHPMPSSALMNFSSNSHTQSISALSGSNATRLSYPSRFDTPTSAFRSNSVSGRGSDGASPAPEGDSDNVPQSSLAALIFGGTILTSTTHKNQNQSIVPGDQSDPLSAPPNLKDAADHSGSSGELSGDGIKRTRLEDPASNNPLELPSKRQTSAPRDETSDGSISSENHMRLMALLETMETQVGGSSAPKVENLLGGSGTRIPQSGGESSLGEVIVSKLQPKTHTADDGPLQHGDSVVPQNNSNTLTTRALESHNLILRMQRNRELSIQKEKQQKQQLLAKGGNGITDFLGDDLWSGEEDDDDEETQQEEKKEVSKLHQERVPIGLSAADAELHRRIHEWVEWEE